MSRESGGQVDQVEALKSELARMGGLSVLFGQAVADHVGIHPTDLESLDILRRNGPMTAGRLAELTGLSTGGAITALIDRLERLGYARRERDTGDRRRVLVRALMERAEREFAPLYAPLEHALDDLSARYDDADLAVILDFVTRTNELMQEQIARVRSEKDGESASR
jgi:DNA-binding MarR family transcriptional regulator